jgi:hypothetical protein
MEELHIDSIDGGHEASYRLGHVSGRGRTPTIVLVCCVVASYLSFLLIVLNVLIVIIIILIIKYAIICLLRTHEDSPVVLKTRFSSLIDLLPERIFY